jgi:hypothetical protein
MEGRSGETILVRTATVWWGWMFMKISFGKFYEPGYLSVTIKELGPGY